TLYNPEARARSETIGNGEEAEVDFQLWDPRTTAASYELHLLRARRHAGGLVVREFVFRHFEPGDAGLINFREAIKALRKAWETDLAEAHWPLPAAEADRAARWKEAVDAIRWYIHSPHVFVERKLMDIPFTLAHRPKPPEHAWLYIKPE